MQVDDLTIDVGQRHVSRDSEKLDVAGLTFDLLLAIVQAAPNIVSSDELVEKVWSGRPTSPETITQRAMMLRQALGDSAEAPRYIEVVRGQGFRLIPEAASTTDHSVASAQATSKTAITLIIVLALLASVVWMAKDEPQPQEAAVVETEPQRLPRSVAVLPFANLSPNPDNAFFADGLHSEILNQLGKISELNVIARTSVLQYIDAKRPITDIAKELNVESIMEGSVSYAEGRVAVRTQLIDADSGVQLWSDSYNTEFSDIFGIQADIASNVANALKVEFSVVEQATIERPPTESAEAYALYLQALGLFGTLGFETQIELLDRALAIDPQFGRAHAQKAALYAFALRFGVQEIDAREDYAENAVKHAEIAISIDPTLGYAHAALGLVHEASLNGPAAKQEFDKSYELSPNDPAVLVSYGRFLRNIGDIEAAVRAGERSVELDPNNRQYLHQLGVTYRYAHRYRDAKIAYTRSLQLVPDNIPSRLSLAASLAMLGDREAALNEMRIADQLMADAPNSNVFAFAQRVAAYRLTGRGDLAATAFKAFENRAAETRTGSTMWAMAYVGLGDFDNALRELEKAALDLDSVELAPLTEMKANLWSDPEMDSPEFKAALDRLGFNFPDETT